MKDDDGSRKEIFFNPPSNVPDRGMYRVVSIRRAEDAHVSVRSSNSELSGPCYATGWAEELRPCLDIDCLLSLLQVVAKDGIRVAQNRRIHEIMVTDFVSARLNTGNYLRVAESSVADKEEGGMGIVLLEDIKHLWREDGVWAIIKRKANQGTSGPNPIDNVGRHSLEHTQDIERVYPKRHTDLRKESSCSVNIPDVQRRGGCCSLEHPAKQTASIPRLFG